MCFIHCCSACRLSPKAIKLAMTPIRPAQPELSCDIFDKSWGSRRGDNTFDTCPKRLLLLCTTVVPSGAMVAMFTRRRLGQGTSCQRCRQQRPGSRRAHGSSTILRKRFKPTRMLSYLYECTGANSSRKLVTCKVWKETRERERCVCVCVSQSQCVCVCVSVCQCVCVCVCACV